MNIITLTGRLTSAPELKQSTSGKSVVSVNLAVDRPYAKDVTDFIPIVMFGQPAEYIARYAKKGSKIAVTGKLTTRNYEDKNGNKRTAFEVVADIAEICEARENTNEAKSDPTNKPFMPDAYKAQPKFEDTEVDGQLPF